MLGGNWRLHDAYMIVFFNCILSSDNFLGLDTFLLRMFLLKQENVSQKFRVNGSDFEDLYFYSFLFFFLQF